MNTRWFAPSLCLALCASPALAQEGPPPERDEALVAPEIPEVPEALRAAVERLAPIVDDTAECYTERGERMEHEAAPQCPAWYARLARGGLASVFAIGAQFRPVEIDRGRAPREPIRYAEGQDERGPRLVQLLTRTRRPEVLPFLVSYLVRTATSDEDGASSTVLAILRGLRELTGDDPAPTAPWENDAAHLRSTRARVELARAWSRWYREHQGSTPAQWRAEGLDRAQRRLSSDDPVEVYSALVRLAPVRAQRAAVVSALHATLAREDLSAAARVQLLRLARQRGLPLPRARAAVRA